MITSIHKFGDLVKEFNDWSITSPPHTRPAPNIIVSNNTGNPAIADINTQIHDLMQKHAADILNNAVPKNTMNTPPEESFNSFQAQLDIFEMPEIVKINALKREAQAARTLFLHKVSNAMVFYDAIDKVVIAGGCFTSWYHGEPVKDIDVFILNNKHIHDALFSAVKNEPSRFKIGNSSYMSNDRVTYTAFDTATKIQYISTDYNSREELLSHFDAVHDCISFVQNKLYICREAFDAMRTKTLKENRGNKIAGWRIKKFVGERGFRVR